MLTATMKKKNYFGEEEM